MPLPVFLTPAEVALMVPGVSQAQSEAMIRAVTARAVGVAPCLTSDALSEVQRETVRAIILDAVMRWASMGGGQATTLESGPFRQTVDTRSGDRRGAFLRSEFDDLQGICDSIAGASREAFTIHVGGSRVARRANVIATGRDLISWDEATRRGWGAA